MTFSDCKTALSLNVELKRVKGNFIWSLVLTLISASASRPLPWAWTSSWNRGRETLHSILMKKTSFSDIYCTFFDFNQWNYDFRLYEPCHSSEISLSPSGQLSPPCGRGNCEIFNILKPGKEFKSTVTQEIYKMKCVVYLITCKVYWLKSHNLQSALQSI